MAKARPSRPRTANETLLNDAVRHAVHLQRYSNQEVREVVGFLNRDMVPALEADLAKRLANITTRGMDKSIESTQRLQDLETSTHGIIGSAMSQAHEKFEGDMSRFALSESQWAKASVTQAAPIDLSLDLPNVQTLKSIVTSRPFEGRVLGDWFGGLAEKTQSDVSKQVNIGIAAGRTNDEIVRSVIGTKANKYTDGVLQTSRRGAESVVRTAVNHVSTHAREETYKENSDVIDQVRWVSTLDDRTTPVCMANDGKLFPINEGPRPPAHFGCRSTTVPVLKSWKELGIDLKEADAGTRASMDGQVPADLTYNEWLKQQPEAVQDEALGKARADMFREGMSVDKFVNDQGKTLTLDELRKLNDMPPLPPEPEPPQPPEPPAPEPEKPSPSPEPEPLPLDVPQEPLTQQPEPPAERTPPPGDAEGSAVREHVLKLVDDNEAEKEVLFNVKKEADKEIQRIQAEAYKHPDAPQWSHNEAMKMDGPTMRQAYREFEYKRADFLRKNYPELEAQYEKLRNADSKIREVNKLFNESVQSSFYVNDPNDMKLHGVEQLSGSVKRKAKDAQEWLRRVVSKKVVSNDVSYQQLRERERAFHSEGSIHIAPSDGAKVVVHEVGHAFEYYNRSWAEKARAFLRSRTAGESAELLSKVKKNAAYGSDEITKKDKFINAYMGRIYRSGSTEITSMALEMLFDDPVRLAKQDPEMFEWIINMIRGVVK